ncbi:MAG TPA: PLP-dependent aminotransferase family protein [Candidatus Sulfotelmatobacter sp.]|nr:PLP-dependent aminotransferase family protein [Candidatus Sulfotelmatobacter sp.]
MFRQVYTRLREAMLSGALRGGEKLPSTRDLAEQLGISRTVVLTAYDQLLAEGFAEGRMGSGTYVSSGVGSGPVASPGKSVSVRVSRFGKTAGEEWSRMNFALQMPRSGLPYDFAYGRSDLGNFPFAMWRRILLRCARKTRVAELDYGHAAGSTALREAICAHVRRSRAVVCDASQIVVVNGSQQALDLIARVLMEPGDHVAFEDPSYQGTWEVLRAAGVHLLPIVLDQDGLDPARIPDEARIVFVTPSHQFPTGTILPLARRLALLKWAKRRNAVVVEDDYDGEFRYEGQPLESLQGLDREGRVIYIGTFSRTVFSALRIGYLIAPKRLVQAFTAAKWLCDRHTATLEQATLAEFISSGMYERYLRQVRRRNSSRRKVLMAAIRSDLGNRVEVTGDGSGAHVVLWPRRRISEASVISKAAAHGVRVYGISAYCLGKPRRTGIMLGYSRMGEAQIREGIRRLGQVI